MSSAIKLENINTHVVDIFGSVKGRDQPILKMDKAVDLIKCLGEEILSSDEYVFFDPFCKAGEILLATALLSVLFRKNKKLISLEEISKELYESNRFFALSPDQRHYCLSLRTFFGNKNSHDNEKIKNFRNGNYLSEVDGRLDKDKFQKESNAMIEFIKEKIGDKKIVVVGNPPYQEEDGGSVNGKSAKPIYNFFVESLIDLDSISEFCLVIPSRWFAGGKGLDQFRSKMIMSRRIKKIRYFENPHHIFPTVEIRGGVCFFHCTKKSNIKTIIDNGLEYRHLDLSKYDIIVPHIRAYSILEKVLGKSNKFISQVVWSRNPFGLTGTYFRRIQSYPKGSIQCVCERREVKNISRKLISKNSDKIGEYKVAFPKASGGGKGERDKVLPRPEHFFILDKNQVSTETYSIASSFDSLKEAKNFLIFLQTYFSRFLLGLRKPSHNTNRTTFSWIPLMDSKKSWTDEALFKYFNIDDKEQNYIKKKVDDWTA